MSQETENGNELYHLLIELTGLEKEKIAPEVDRVMKELKLHPSTLTTDDLRRVMIYYLDELASNGRLRDAAEENRTRVFDLED